MTPTRARVLLSLAALAAAHPLGGASATPPLQIVDPAGDAVGARASVDITGVGFALVKSRGASGRLRQTLKVTMTLAGDADATPGVRFVVNATTSKCGDMMFVAGKSIRPLIMASCASASAAKPITADVTFGKNTVTWSISMLQVPPEISVGSTMSEFDAYTDVGDPLTGVIGSDVMYQLGAARDNPTHGKAVLDFARGDVTWIIR